MWVVHFDTMTHLPSQKVTHHNSITFHRRTFESNIWHTISWKWLANDAHLRNTSAWRKWRSHWHTKWRNVVKWLTMTHIRVSIVTDILRPWRYCASRFWGTWRNHDAPFPGVKRCVLQMTSALLPIPFAPPPSSILAMPMPQPPTRLCTISSSSNF